MEQHPIPQQISSYEFKLVGEMTLKQFTKAAVGVIAALVVKNSSLIFFIKWPLAALLAGGGLALAFVPYQDRPLEIWISAFLKRIYAPTIYLWKKSSDKNWLGVDYSKDLSKEEEERIEVPIKDEKRVEEFIQSLPSVKRERAESKAEAGLVKETVKADEAVDEGRAAETTGEAKVEAEEDWRDKKTDLKLERPEKLEATGEVKFGTIPMPDTPDLPNVLVGMVTDERDKIVEDAIVEIQDAEGNPSRVLKTNSLGQFRSSTQLQDGEYLVITEKEDYDFDRVKINLSGKIVQPIKIQAI